MNKEIIILNIFIYIFFFRILFILLINTDFHPINIIIILLIYRIIICLNLSLWKSNFLYSIILFLIIIRGLLIIFLYFSSLISNEKFNLKINKFLIFIFILNIIIFFYLNNQLNFINLFLKKFNFNETKNLTKLNEINFQNILNLYEYPFNNLTILSIFYLLISLFTIIKICSSKSISIRKITN